MCTVFKLIQVLCYSYFFKQFLIKVRCPGAYPSSRGIGNYCTYIPTGWRLT
jgi:hypothetical protein